MSIIERVQPKPQTRGRGNVEQDQAQRSKKLTIAEIGIVCGAGVSGLVGLFLLAWLVLPLSGSILPFMVASALPLFTLFAVIYQAVVYRRQWNAMQDTLKEMGVSRELENRAWVGLKDLKFEPRPAVDGVVGANLIATFINSGQSPAIVTITIEGKELEQSPPDDLAYPVLPTKASQLPLFPHAEVEKELISLPKGVPIVLNPKSPEHAWYIYGTIQYEDIFGYRHTTKFCYATMGVGSERGVRLRLAPTHNNFD
jgi:hypothetical protein